MIDINVDTNTNNDCSSNINENDKTLYKYKYYPASNNNVLHDITNQENNIDKIKDKDTDTDLDTKIKVKANKKSSIKLLSNKAQKVNQTQQVNNNKKLYFKLILCNVCYYKGKAEHCNQIFKILNSQGYDVYLDIVIPYGGKGEYYLYQILDKNNNSNLNNSNIIESKIDININTNNNDINTIKTNSNKLLFYNKNLDDKNAINGIAINNINKHDIINLVKY